MFEVGGSKYCYSCGKKLTDEEYKNCIEGLEWAKRQGNIDYYDETNVECQKCINDSNDELSAMSDI